MTLSYKPEIMSAAEFSRLRENPDRGFRIETYITLGSNTVMFHPEQTPEQYLDAQLELYKDVPVKLVQVYVYLIEYCHAPLDEKAFFQLKSYLEALQARGLRAVLRFAYEFSVNRKTGPRSGRIYKHLSQLREWFAENRTFVSDTVLVLQAGVIGAWGEWHTAKYPHNQKNILFRICQLPPAEIPIQVRLQALKDKLAQTPDYEKIGFHDDFLVGGYHKWNTSGGAPGSRAYERFVQESKNALNDGEMPWGRDKTVNNGYIDGKEMLVQCRDHALTTLSITHNFIEENGCFNAVRWQTEKLGKKDAMKLGCTFFSSYFKDASGQPVERTVFDFLTDHLGYQIAVTSIEIQDNNLHIQLANNGFALPFGFTEMKLCLKDQNGDCTVYPVQAYTPEKLCGGESARFTVKIADGIYTELGILIRKPHLEQGYIRMANHCEFRDGFNLIDLKA